MSTSQPQNTNKIGLNRIPVFVYGVVVYIIFFLTFLYAVGFVGNFAVPKTIDGIPQVSLSRAILIDVSLLGIFAIQHSVMARQGFKNWWTKIVPKAIERSTYVLLTNLCLILLFWQWQPIGGVIWELHNLTGRIILLSLFGFGWLLVLVSSFLINHFDLFGLRQVYLYWRDREYSHLPFITPGLYKYIRHPLYVGWFLAFWSTPKMTVTHLLFAVVTTLYILVAVQFEEKDLVKVYGEVYAEYRRKVPMFVPFLGKKKSAQNT
ncbi:MAG: isoprenylcysteine carboxylmethyltransferase family protein [Prochloraceae cyanobacterium]|nr:isoprenylcysteine carboxylmethyltransferase family protein [Prochloraceae cyanobacterium]